jgi:hypothetical protein
MALVLNSFSIFGLFAALHAGLTETAKGRSKGLWLTPTNYPRHSERRPSWGRQRASQGLPGSVFDARYNGLTAHAAYLDAAICRRERLR